MKICWANTDSFEESNMVILGVPDESKSHSLRKGSSEAPHKIREISNIRDSYKRGSNTSTGFPIEGINCKIYDLGNALRSDIGATIDRIVSKSKLPVVLGGDHSITTEIVRSMHKEFGKISLVYFDAHPDFIGSAGSYYGSVLYDVLPYIDLTSSFQLGIRTPEQEEIDNIKKHGINVFTPLDFLRKGITAIEDAILEKIGRNTYISIDMDSIDPAYAPGVSVPVPLGLQSLEVLYLLKSITKKGMVGMDIMEVCPNYDIKDRTSHLASRIIGEVAASFQNFSS